MEWGKFSANVPGNRRQTLVSDPNPFSTTMADPTSPSSRLSLPRPPLEDLLPAIGSTTRWSILRELIKEPLPVCELALRFRYTDSAMSKQLGVLFEAGIVRRGYGGLYSIQPQYLVPGEAAIDFGHALLRLK
jgi:DNA-binding transcriptional ArsR family regulator